MEQLIISYLFLINICGFAVMGIDKRKAQKGKWRTSEKTLWFLAVFGGALGLTIGMWSFRHKTKHFIFKYGLPVITVVEVIICYLLLGLVS